MAHNKGNHSNGGGNRGRPYALMLLLAFGAALLGVMVLHKLRERRIYNLLVKEKDLELLALQLLFRKERDHTKELKRKNEEMKAKLYSLRSQKMELDRRVLEMQSTIDSMKDEQKQMGSEMEEKQNEIRMLQDRRTNSGSKNPKVLALTGNLKQKEAEIEDLKHHLEVSVKSHWVSIKDPANLPEDVSANGKMPAQENKEKYEESQESTEYGNGKRITDKDASKSKLTGFKDGEATMLAVEHEIRDRMGNKDRLMETEEHFQKQETLQVEGKSGRGTASDKISDGKQGKVSEDSQNDGAAGVVTTGSGEKTMEGNENKTIREEQPRQLENNTDGGGQNFNVKQLAENSKSAGGVKGKHGHVSRTKGKKWRMIVQNTLQGSYGDSEGHGTVKIRSRKVYRDEKDQMKDRIVGRASDDENAERDEEEEIGDSNNQIEDKADTKLLKPENHADQENAENKTTNNTKNQETNSGIYMRPRTQGLNEARQSEKQEDSGVQQSWSRRHINKVEMNSEQTKTGMFHQSEELLAANGQEQERDAVDGGDDEDGNDEFFKESQSDFEDQKEDYIEEIGESEFQAGLR